MFVHTSRWEGFGIVLLEAMLASLPIVATRVSAVPEVVVDGETGLLVEPGDVEALAAALDALLADPERARALGAAGAQRARSEFSVARMAERTIGVYRAESAALDAAAPLSPARHAARAPEPDRIFFTSIWFKGHNNPRYAELLPRLRAARRLSAVASDERIRAASSTAPSAGAARAQPRHSSRSPTGATGRCSPPTTSRSATSQGPSSPTSTTRASRRATSRCCSTRT